MDQSGLLAQVAKRGNTSERERATRTHTQKSKTLGSFWLCLGAIGSQIRRTGLKCFLFCELFSLAWAILACMWRQNSLKSKTKQSPKFFILVRGEREFIYICLQLFGSIACFIRKPAHFNSGLWRCVTESFERVCQKYILISWVLAYWKLSRIIRKSAYVNTCFSVQIISGLASQSRFKMFTLWPACRFECWCTDGGAQHEGSILSSVNLWKIFRRISAV